MSSFLIPFPSLSLLDWETPFSHLVKSAILQVSVSLGRLVVVRQSLVSASFQVGSAKSCTRLEEGGWTFCARQQISLGALHLRLSPRHTASCQRKENTRPNRIIKSCCSITKFASLCVCWRRVGRGNEILIRPFAQIFSCEKASNNLPSPGPLSSSRR